MASRSLLPTFRRASLAPLPQLVSNQRFSTVDYLSFLLLDPLSLMLSEVSLLLAKYGDGVFLHLLRSSVSRQSSSAMARYVECFSNPPVNSFNRRTPATTSNLV